MNGNVPDQAVRIESHRVPEHVTYKNPPVKEAVCEFRFSGGVWDAALPGLIYVRLKDRFPERRMSQVLNLLTPSGGGAGTPPGFQVAQFVQFVQTDGCAFVQLAPNVLSIHHLAPYSGWSTFQPLIERVWGAYVSEAKPEGIARIGLRYVNDLRIINADPLNPEAYLNFYPHIGSELPQDYIDASMSVLFVEGVDSLEALRAQFSTLRIPEEKRATLALDLDCFSSDKAQIGLSDALSRVEQFHERVRAVFEACITDKLRDLLEPLAVVNH